MHSIPLIFPAYATGMSYVIIVCFSLSMFLISISTLFSTEPHWLSEYAVLMMHQCLIFPVHLAVLLYYVYATSLTSIIGFLDRFIDA